MKNNKWRELFCSSRLAASIFMASVSTSALAQELSVIDVNSEPPVAMSASGEFEGGGPGGAGSAAEIPEINSLAWEGVEDRLTAFDNDLMGDSIDFATGTLSFSQTDVSLPGNFPLEVAIRRKTSGRALQPESSGFFADWQLDVPNMSMLMQKRSSNGVAYNWPNRCTSNTQPDYYNTLWSIEEVWEGLNVSLPGKGSERVLDFPDSRIFGTHAPTKSTKSHLLISCISNIGTANGGGQGFLVKTTDGTEYRFDVLDFLDAEDAKKGTDRLERHLGILYASQVTDKNGNTVNYTYDSNRRLTRISASDGRTINLSYNSSGMISSVNANGRVWTYSYANVSNNSIDNTQTLTRVTQPDGRYWSFSMGNWRTFTLPGHCTRQTFSISMTHPYGTTGQFTIAEKRFGKSGVQNTMKTQNEINALTRCNEDYTHHITPWFENLAVTEKRLSGPSIDTAVWTYQYQTDSGNFVSTEGSWDLRRTSVIDPLGQKTEFYHNRRWGPKNGQLERVVVYNSNGAVLRETNNTYITQGTIFGSFQSNLLHVDNANSTTAQYQTKSVVSQAGDTYTTEYTYNTNPASSTYSYGQPTREKRYSNVNTTARDTITSFTHLKSNWILGLPQQITTNGRNIERNTYDSLGRKTKVEAYGHTLATFGYHGNSSYKGALYWIKDAEDRITYAYSWKRGKPQQVKRPDGKSTYLTLDNNGWVTQSKDALNRTTYYSYDNMGRNTLINPPGSWENTAISYSFGNTHRQTITKGNARTVITYDNFFRPILEETRDLSTNSSTYVNIDYDALGQRIFSSFPSTSSSSAAGTAITYDGLGRVVTERETVSPYATTSHQYLSSHRHRVTDPLGHYQDMYQYGYEGPDSGNNREIRMYSSGGSLQSTTRITQNVWGQITQLRQFGSTNGYSVDQSRYYYYDSRQRVCRQRDPDVGDTVFQYDDSGWLMAYQKGLSAGTSCATPSGTGKVSFIRDSLGQPTRTDFAHSGTPDIYRTYDAVGNLKTINRGGANWTYNYNDIDLLEDEKLTVDGRTYFIDYTYNTSGDLSTKKLPSGRVISFSPDGLGRATRAATGSVNFASNISYHATGAVASFTYGNGYSFSQTLNSRTLPSRILSQYGSTKALDFTYSYDKNGNTTSITDGAVSVNNRSNGYDAMGRLLSFSGPWGSGSVVYDSLGNIRSKTLGSRSVDVSYNSNYLVTRSTDTGGFGGNTGTRNFSHDSRGNVTQAGGFAFTYDYADQPTAVSGSTSGSYKYDGNLKRVKSTVGGDTIYNVYDLSGALVTVDNVSQNERTEYVSAAGMTVARIMNTATTYIHSDYLGSPVAGTNNNRSVLWREKYSPFGITSTNSAANDDQAGFTGHIKDDSTGLNYMQARYYDPVIGRFYSNDPIGYTPKNPVMSFNRYMYVNNNPYKYTDPNGEFLLQAAGAIGGALLGVAAQAVADISSGNAPTVGKYLGAAAGGAVAGVVATTTFNPGAASAAGLALKGAVAGGLGGATGNAIQQKVDTGSVDLGEVGKNGLTGAIIGAVVPGLKVPGITSGQGSFSAVAKTANTKLANGTISNVSNKTVVKAVTADVVQGGGQAATSSAALATCQSTDDAC